MLHPIRWSPSRSHTPPLVTAFVLITVPSPLIVVPVLLSLLLVQVPHSWLHRLAVSRGIEPKSNRFLRVRPLRLLQQFPIVLITPCLPLQGIFVILKSLLSSATSCRTSPPRRPRSRLLLTLSALPWNLVKNPRILLVRLPIMSTSVVSSMLQLPLPIVPLTRSHNLSLHKKPFVKSLAHRSVNCPYTSPMAILLPLLRLWLYWRKRKLVLTPTTVNIVARVVRSIIVWPCRAPVCRNLVPPLLSRPRWQCLVRVSQLLTVLVRTLQPRKCRAANTASRPSSLPGPCRTFVCRTMAQPGRARLTIPRQAWPIVL